MCSSVDSLHCLPHTVERLDWLAPVPATAMALVGNVVKARDENTDRLAITLKYYTRSQPGE